MPNNKLTGPVWFIPTVVEIYKDEKGISGKDAANYLLETGAMWYLTEAWKGLHVTGLTCPPILVPVPELVEI